ncbi:MAG: peptidoglycan recognition family protein [Elusimicrobiales bacterium]|nr:peptidoglycan recognition family protein [Elusimicrobiales bacterium]
MTARLRTALLSLSLLASFLPGAAYAENIPVFTGLPYPITGKLSAGQKEGFVFFNTPFSEPPSADYDTVFLQGEMPDPGVTLQLAVKGSYFFSPASNYASEAFRRFPNGRFWARYRVPATRQPLKISMVNRDVKTNSSVIIYEAELTLDADSKEEPLPQSTAPYVAAPELFLPDSAPFKVIRRADWQAAPPTQPYTPHEPRYFTLHHTAAHYPGTYKEAVAEMQFIQDFHQNGRGWIDIAYHFLIDPAGNIFEGRPIKVLGAHVKNRNTANIGISIMGDYHPPKSNLFTPASQDSFVAIGRYLRDTYEVPVSSFYAHRDIGDTTCPGDDLYAKKEFLRGLIFTPQEPQPVPVDPAAAPPPTPAQEQSLRQLMQFLNNPCPYRG